MKRLEKLTRKNLGEVLLDEGLLTRGQLAEAELEQKRSGDSLGSVLVGSRALSEWELAKVVVGQYHLPFVMLSSIGMSKDVKDILPDDILHRGRFVPIAAFGKVLTLAIFELPPLQVLEAVEEHTGCVPYLYVTVKSEIDHLLQGTEVEAAPEDEGNDEDLTETIERLSGEEIAVLDQVFGGGTDGPLESQADPQAEMDESDNSTSWQDIFDSANQSILKDIDE